MSGLDVLGVRVLAAVGELGSLTAAAKRLGVSQPTAGRHLRALEAALGAPLVVRHGRGVALSPAGEELLEAACAVDAAVARFGRQAAARARVVRGLVRVSASEPVGAELLPRWVAALRGEYPRVQVAVVAENRVSDLGTREVDLAVRMFRPQEQDLVAVKVGETQLSLYASRDYVARRGAPTADRASLLDHDLIGFDRDPFLNKVFHELVGPLPPERVALRTDAHGPSLSAVRAGVGVTAVQRVIAARYPELVQVAPEVPMPRLEVWLATPHDLRRSDLVRTAFDHLRAWLAAELAA